MRVAPATADVHIILEVPETDKIHIEDRHVHIILEVPATDKIHIEDRYGLAELSQTM